MLEYFKDELITRLRIYAKCTEFSMKDTISIDTLSICNCFILVISLKITFLNFRVHT